jgi:hypothetical protein
MSGSGYIYDPGLLDDLARNHNALLRLEAALNRHTRPDTLIGLIGDRDGRIRSAATRRITDKRFQQRLTAEQSERLLERLLGLLERYHILEELVARASLELPES